jgi:hypothetical protein
LKPSAVVVIGMKEVRNDPYCKLEEKMSENFWCDCGFKFADPGQFRNCDAFINEKGQGGVICPVCKKGYVSGVEVKVEDRK